MDSPSHPSGRHPPLPAKTHRRSSSLLSGLHSFTTFLSASASSTLCTDTELVISDPVPTEWADDSFDAAISKDNITANSIIGTRSRANYSASSGNTDRPLNVQSQHKSSSQPKNLGPKVHLKAASGHKLFLSAENQQVSSIAFPTSSSRNLTQFDGSDGHMSSRSSQDHGTVDPGSSPFGSPHLYSSSSTPASSVRHSPQTPPLTLELDISPAQRCTGKPETLPLAQPTLIRHWQTTSRSNNENSPSSDSKLCLNLPSVAHPQTFSIGTATSRTDLMDVLNRVAAPDSTCQSVNRAAGFRARSINSIRGLAATWVPSRFMVNSSSSQCGSLNPTSPEMETNQPLAPVTTATELCSRKQNTILRNRPVKLDRRRLDKAVSLAVEAAQAAEEDERLWEEKQVRRTQRQHLLSTHSQHQSNASEADPRQDKTSSFVEAQALVKAKTCDSLSNYHQADMEADDEARSDYDEGDAELGFSLDLYISSLGYLISAISDREAPGLSDRQKNEIRQRLEEGMSKLGFDAKAELEKAQAMRRELALEKEKATLRQEQQQPACIIHNHYHAASPSASMFNDGMFARAHAAAKASETTTSFAGKIGNSVLDIGLCIGAGALSALSANLSAIAPRTNHQTKLSDSLKSDDCDSRDDAVETPNSNLSSGTATPTTAWAKALGSNANQWELAVAFASSASSALAGSLGVIAKSETFMSLQVSEQLVQSQSPLSEQDRMALSEQDQNAATETLSAEDRLILVSASLARALKRSPLPSQLYQLLCQLVSTLAALDARYSLTERGTKMAVRQTLRALSFVRKHELHVKAVRVAWATAEAAVAALEAYRDEKGWQEIQAADWSVAWARNNPSKSNKLLQLP